MKFLVLMLAILAGLASALPKQNSECTLCGLVVGITEKFVDQGNANVTDIEVALTQMCSQLPPHLRQPCNDFVNQTLSEILAALENQTPPSQVCKKLGFCKQAFPVTDLQLPQLAGNSSAFKCTLCQFLAYLAEVAVKEEKWNQTELINEMNAFCGTLPEGLKLSCEAWVYLEGSTVANAIENGADPTTVCQDFDICTNSTSGVTQRSKIDFGGIQTSSDTTASQAQTQHQPLPANFKFNWRKNRKN